MGNGNKRNINIYSKQSKNNKYGFTSPESINELSVFYKVCNVYFETEIYESWMILKKQFTLQSKTGWKFIIVMQLTIFYH